VRIIAAPPLIVWLVLAFAGGIAVAGSYPVPAGWTAAVALVGAVGLVVGQLGRGGLWRRGGAVVLVAAMGLAHATLDGRRQPTWPEAVDGHLVVAEGRIVGPPEPTLRGWRAVVHLDSVAPRRTRARRESLQDPSARARYPPDDDPGASGGDTFAVSDRIRLVGRGRPPEAGVGARVIVRGWFRAGRPAGNPGERSERAALRRRGLAGVLAVGEGSLVVRQAGGWSVRGMVAGVRRRVVDSALAALPPPDGGLLLSLLLGIDTHLEPATYRQFSRAGLVHLMVVSGAQVAIVAGACAWTARLARLPVRAAAALTGLGVGAFALMVEWAPSIGRAVLMAAAAIGGVLLGRPRDRAATLAAAALVLLAASPSALFDVGFQLSFAATWGLLFLAPAVGDHLQRLGARTASALGATLGAQLAVAPLLAAHFQTVSVAGLAANVLVLPLIAAVVPAGFAMIPIAACMPAAGAWLFSAMRPAVATLVWIGARFGDLSWATVAVPSVPGWAATLFFSALALWALAWSRARAGTPLPRFSAVAYAAVAVALWLSQAGQPPRELEVTVLDVGQGDAILVQSPSGRAALIDGGGEIGAERAGWDVGQMRVVPALRRAGVRGLDVVVLTHPHEDHVGGLPAVVENFPVGLVLDPGVPHPSPSYVRLLRLVEAGRIPYRAARAGMSIDLGAGVALSVLHPPEPVPDLEGDPVHAGVVVSRLAFGRSAMLLTGDAEASVERYLIERGVLLESQVLKVGHHGSRTSTTRAFLAAVRPRYAVISVGADNPFGHPHQMTLETLRASGADVLRTDRDGAVRLTSDGLRWRVATFRAGRDARVH